MTWLLLFLHATLCAQPLFKPVAAINYATRIPGYLMGYELLNGHGVGIGDLDGDGLPEVALASPVLPYKLFKNLGEFRFKDVTDEAGMRDSIVGHVTGVALADVNGDGLLDIYLCRGTEDSLRSPNRLWLNMGGLKFKECAREWGVDDHSRSMQAYFYDLDTDGDLDLFLCNTKPDGISHFGSYAHHANQRVARAENKIYYNDQNRRFFPPVVLPDEDWAPTLSAHIADFNGDRTPDIYICNDFARPDKLYLQIGGKFVEKGREIFGHTPHFSMGCDYADLNNDGWPDLMTVDMLPMDNYHEKTNIFSYSRWAFEESQRLGTPQFVQNAFHLNLGDGRYVEIAPLLGIERTDWSWAPLIADFDLDGRSDLLVTNGYKHDYFMDQIKRNTEFKPDYTLPRHRSFSPSPLTPHEDTIMSAMYPYARSPNVLMQNVGTPHEITLVDRSKDWLGGTHTVSHGAAYGDLDGDGDLDLIVNNTDTVVFVYQNMAIEQKRGSYLRVKPEGKNAVGTTVTLKHPGADFGDVQIRILNPQRGYLSSVEPALFFGLGKLNHIPEMEVRWPDGKTQILKKVKANQTLTVKYADAQNPSSPPGPSPTPFYPAEPILTKEFVHVENTFDDFLRDRLLIRRQSRQGPSVAVADVNGDGVDDVYFSGRPGELYLSDPDGKLHPTGTHFGEDKADELGTLFFDADGDGDLDVFSVRGGNETHSNVHALFFNDGTGRFSLQQEFPERGAGMCVAAADFDLDGDLDLFVPGRLVPGMSPIPPKHRLLVNENGRFSDQTQKFAPALDQAGQIGSALWTDADNDGDPDLLMAGEWTPIILFENKNGMLERASVPAFKNTEGWWNSVVAADFDSDGDMDYFLGNVGLNHRFRATPQTPVRVRVGDYDRNGFVDPILFYPMDGKSVPVPGRDQLCKYLPMLFKRFYTYHSYGLATEDSVMAGLESDSMYVAEMKEPRTMWIENRGKKGVEWDFVLHPAPQAAQWGPVCGLLPLDYDGDGDPDVVMTGGETGIFHDHGRWDGMRGMVLNNDGKGKFTAVMPAQSGFWVGDDGRALAPITLASGKTVVIAARNAQSPVFFALNAPQGRPMEIKERAWEYRWPDGRKRREEFYPGAGYMSQFPRPRRLPSGNPEVVVFN
jgi:hypothetical protein